MKKIIAAFLIILSIATVLSFAGCGEKVMEDMTTAMEEGSTLMDELSKDMSEAFTDENESSKKDEESSKDESDESDTTKVDLGESTTDKAQ